MSGDKSCGKEVVQYTVKQPDEGSVVTSWDTTTAENEVHSSGDTHRKSMRLKDISSPKEDREKGETCNDIVNDARVALGLPRLGDLMQQWGHEAKLNWDTYIILRGL